MAFYFYPFWWMIPGFVQPLPEIWEKMVIFQGSYYVFASTLAVLVGNRLLEKRAPSTLHCWLLNLTNYQMLGTPVGKQMRLLLIHLPAAETDSRSPHSPRPEKSTRARCPVRQSGQGSGWFRCRHRLFASF